MTIETRMVPTGSARLAVHTNGKGPLCLLVHGYPLDHRMWLEVLNGPLAERRWLCAVDLRGHGESPWTGDAEHSMEQFADDLAAIARTLSNGPVDLVALSMGGYAALAFAERHKALLRSLTLVDTRAAADTAEGQAARHTAMQNVVDKGRHWLAQQMLGKLVAADAPLAVRARLQSMIESTPVETILADLQGMLARKNRRGVLPQIAAPTMVVVGEHDALTPPDEAEAMAKAIPGARFEVIAGAGHLTPMERPAEFQALLASFLT